MAYDEELAVHISALLKGRPGVVEKQMFGRLAIGVCLFFLACPGLRATPAVLNSWYADGTVTAIALQGNAAYLGGDFSQLTDGSLTMARQRLAAITLTAQTPMIWNPGANAQVRQIVMSGSNAYISGDFTTIAGVSRGRIVQLDASGSTGWPTSFNPGVMTGGCVCDFSLAPAALYLGGTFTVLSMTSRYGLGALDMAGLVMGWNPNVGGFPPFVWTIAINGSTAFAGGSFTTVGGLPRASLVAVALAGGLLAWAPSTNGSVLTLALDGGVVYAGGLFTQANGVARNNAAAFDASSGSLLPWDPSPDGRVQKIEVSSSAVYLGGQFSNAGGQARSRLAAVDKTSGLASSWDAQVTGASVQEIVASAGSVFIGGLFSAVAGLPIMNYAQLSEADGGGPTSTVSPTRTVTPTPTRTNTAGSFSSTPTLTASPTRSSTASVTPTWTAVIGTLSSTVTSGSSATSSPTASRTPTRTATATATVTPAGGASHTCTQTPGIAPTFTVSAVLSPIEQSELLRIFAAYPNPAEGPMTIAFSLKEEALWHLKIFNVAGELVWKAEATAAAGTTVLTWPGANLDGNRLASGLYGIQMSATGVLGSVGDAWRWVALVR